MGVLIDEMSFPENKNHFRDEAKTTEVPSAVDSQRPPQRNDDNLSSHCECLCSRAAANDNAEDLVIDDAQQVHAMLPRDDEDSTDDDTCDDADDASVNGEEGAEDHLIEVGHLGFVSLGLIHRSLARHSRCTCHSGVLPEANDYPFPTSPMPSGVQSPQDSLIVEPGSGEHSMMSSQALSVCSRSSSVLFSVGTGQSYTLGPFPVLWNPLRLTEEVTFEYPAELTAAGSGFSVSRGDFSEYDFW